MSRVPRFDPAKPIDLHTHSSASDGTEEPAEVVRQASLAGVGTIALTDHDSTAGWRVASAAAVRHGVTLVPGVELSTQIGRASVHVLGYLVDPQNVALRVEMDAVRESRVTRAERMVARIGADYPLTWADVLAVAETGATVGRPHIADALVVNGVVPNRSAAFDSILHWRGGYYQPHHAPAPERAIELVRAAGGVPVLAHPATRGGAALLDDRFSELLAAGLLGLEIEHRENGEEGKRVLRELAARHDLIVTGSSDYHGSGKPNRLGEHTTAPAMLERIIESASGSSPVYP
ncbi:PHP domain-containing protein [Pseudoclavibacter endophyticus]|uniref:PHP domain-containing protein n=1 Tax=Pseudoclavibacter endophyticus TaxID=1778590 RepID=A0A6H9WS73_9MICO|nr:PHP domain-containing protein [Pseudoclavibacter endophyticus]KAB1649777.1 PHP domain-containing protein [Pseudoclavibacter endophyticus]